MTSFDIAAFVIAAALSLVGVYSIFQGSSKKAKEAILRETRELIEQSKRDAENIGHEAKETLRELKQSAHDENEQVEKHLERLKDSLKLKEKATNDSLSKNGQIEKMVHDAENTIKKMQKEIKEEGEKTVEILFKTCGTKREDVIEQAKISLYQEAIGRKERFIKNHLEATEEDSPKIAREILLIALQKYGGESSVDRSHSLIDVKNESFKAGMVGKNAENITYLEEKFEDIDIIFNDLPKTITVSGGKLRMRQVVKQMIQILQKEHRDVTPKTIEAVIKKAEIKVEKIMMDKAKNAVKTIGLNNVPDGVLEHIGRLHYRTSYGQNALRHCIEVGLFAGIIAAEVGANVEVARIAGFFHDIGKSLSEESDKGHDYITRDILEEYKYPEDITHAAWVHHEAEPPKTLEAKIVMAADALSASRPGARLESLERYLERIRALEAAAGSFEGVKSTFAISAGREVRVIVHPSQVTDEQLEALAHNIAGKIENELTYPGNVKVNVIRRQKWDAIAHTRGDKGGKYGKNQ